MPFLHPTRLVLAVFLALALSQAPAAAAPAYESPPQLRASDVLPKAMLSGPDFRVDPLVTSDGYLNTYILHSRFGDFTVVSTALLRTRISEVAALAVMEQVSNSGQFGTALAGKGIQTVKGAANLVIHPVDTITGTLSGVGKFFMRAQESMTSEKSRYEDSAGQQLIGFSQIKRDYAKQFRVDPYSTNQVLQDKLDALASAGLAGSITGSALQALIPGGVGIAVGSISGSAVLGEVDVSVAPQDLRRQNRESLRGMGVPDSLTRLFIDNTVFTPVQQTGIVQALASMDGVKGRDAFIGFAADTDSQDLALFRQRMSQMYAGYALKVGSLDRFVTLGRFVGAATPGGKLILAFPLDYLSWTETTAKIVAGLRDAAAANNLAGAEVWFTGKASPLCRKEFKRLGFTVHENAADKLLDGK